MTFAQESLQVFIKLMNLYGVLAGVALTALGCR